MKGKNVVAVLLGALVLLWLLTALRPDDEPAPEPRAAAQPAQVAQPTQAVVATQPTQVAEEADEAEAPEAPDAPRAGGSREAVVEHFKGPAEPAARDAVWTADDIFKVGVLDDGTPRDGYARYVCGVLDDFGFGGQKVWVQVIDIAHLVRTDEWVRLGEARCG